MVQPERSILESKTCAEFLTFFAFSGKGSYAMPPSSAERMPLHDGQTIT